MDWEAVQKHIRQDGVDDDKDYVETFVIPAVRDRGEAATQRAFMGPQTWQLIMDAFPCGADYIEIPRPPLISIVAVTYLDTAGVTQTWDAANYVVQKFAGPRCRRGRLVLPYGGLWPVTRLQRGAVTIEFTAGYGDASKLPPQLVNAMLVDAGTLYENRERIVVSEGRPTLIEIPQLSKHIYELHRSYPRQLLKET